MTIHCYFYYLLMVSFRPISDKYELIDNVPLKCDIDFAIMFHRHMFVIMHSVKWINNEERYALNED